MNPRILVLAAILLFCFPYCLNGQTPSISVQLLKDLWSRDGNNLEVAQKSFETTAVRDGNTLFAYALNRINHYRYRDGLSVAREASEKSPEDFDVWATLSWLEVLLQNNNEGMLALQKLKASIQVLEADSAKRGFYIRHMGRLIGFLEGPAGGGVNQEILTNTISLIEEKLTPDESKAFIEARQAVVDEFVKLGGKRELAKTDFLADAKAKAEAETKVLEGQNELIMKRRESIPSQISKLTDDFNSQTSSLRAQAQPLQSQIGMLQAQHSNLQIELQQHYAQVAYYQGLLNRTRDPNDRFWIINQMNQFQLFCRNVESQILGVQGQLRSIDSQLGSLNRQAQQVNAQYNSQVGRLQAELNELDRQLGRNMSKTQKLAEPPKRITGEALTLSQRLDKLKTYYDLPSEQLRNDLLEKIKAQE
jgi:uncharacterized phage infection (PIP) family protein YhgE